MMYSAIIIDDEKSARENLQMMIKNLSPNCILHEARNIIEAKSIIEKEDLQVVFLDINMPQHNGFDLFELISLDNYLVVIVTAHLNHSLKAIKIRAFDFLLKPFGFSTLKDTLERINKELSNKKEVDFRSKKITFKTRYETYYVDPNEIAYCESDNNYTTVFLVNKKKLVLSKSIKSIEEELNFPYLFRVHRSYIVNVNLISKYNSLDGFVFLLDDTVRVPVSDRKKKQFAILIQS